MHVKICNGLLITLISFMPFITIQAKDNNFTPKKQRPSGPISNPNPNVNRSVVITCPVCPNYVCTGVTGITGITGITGCTGPGCTGPCMRNITSSFCCLGISQSATIRGSITADTETLSGNLTVGTNVDFKGDIIVEGSTNLESAACVAGALDVSNNLFINGFEVILGSLVANDGITIDGNLTLSGNETLNGSLTIDGNSTVGGNLNAGCAASFGKLLTAQGPSGASLSVFNGSIINGGLTILNTGCTAPTGPSFCTGATINGDLCTVGDISVSGDFDIRRQLIIDNNTTFNGNLINTGTLITNSTVVLNDGLTIAGGDEIINSGNLILVDPLGIMRVGGDSVFQGTITANAGAIISAGGLIVDSGERLPFGDFSVPLGSVTVGGVVTAGGPITSSAGQSSLAGLTISSTQNALCSTGPAALVVAGGVGIAKDLWEGGCQFFEEVALSGEFLAALIIMKKHPTPLHLSGVD